MQRRKRIFSCLPQSVLSVWLTLKSLLRQLAARRDFKQTDPRDGWLCLGAGTDATARAVAERIADQQKWTIVVENRPGNGGGAMLNQLKSQPADGYFVGVASTDAISFNPAAADVGYTPDDFSYLGSAMQLLVGLVALKTKTVRRPHQLLEFAKKNGRATISTGGPNQELLRKAAERAVRHQHCRRTWHWAAEAMTAALGGHVDASMQASLHVAHIKAGKMNQLASLIDRRVPYAPDQKRLASLVRLPRRWNYLQFLSRRRA